VLENVISGFFPDFGDVQMFRATRLPVFGRHTT